VGRSRQSKRSPDNDGAYRANSHRNSFPSGCPAWKAGLQDIHPDKRMYSGGIQVA